MTTTTTKTTTKTTTQKEKTLTNTIRVVFSFLFSLFASINFNLYHTNTIYLYMCLRNKHQMLEIQANLISTTHLQSQVCQSQIGTQFDKTHKTRLSVRGIAGITGIANNKSQQQRRQEQPLEC